MRARDLAAGYQDRAVWSGANFEIQAGEFVAVLGPNGAGKSTLLKLLIGLLAPRRGTLEVLGSAPRRGNPAIGYVPQARVLDPEIALRGLDLVQLGVDGHRWGFRIPFRSAHAQDAAVAATIESVGASAYARRKLGQISGGERQRLLLAQALVGDPSLLLLDEPLANLDVRNQAAMADLIGQLARSRNLAVVIVAHDLNPLRGAIDRVCYVAGGGVAIGKPDEIITPEVLSRLYGAPVEVLVDSRGRRFVVGIEEELAHPHPGPTPEPAPPGWG
ncbi:MAG TPA: ATP-binding cassette domain-containing protein [Candidatus Dormibacteraeota bacterium]|nr:ATP-binding cassette domain-containing protein [Candidatus Dormibacteraeota bacterium]